MNLNVSPSSFSNQDQIDEVLRDQNDPFSPQVLYNSTHDHARFYYHQLHQPHYYHQQGDKYSTNVRESLYDDDEVEIKVKTGLKLGVWNDPSVKWKHTKIRQKPEDRVTLKINSSGIINKVDDDQKHQQQQYSSSLETDLSSNSYCNVNNSPTRVCSDCNTTKTPLWRSGPNGPKSLCNACGIRQRKARRAMAAAVAASNGMEVLTDQPPGMKIKVQPKEKTSKNGHASKIKKRCKVTSTSAGSSSHEQKKLDLEDFLLNLSKNLALQRVFPQDEKDAAILLMAMSSGLVHG